MGKYINTLIERESLFNETSENYILEDQKEKVFPRIPTSTHCQNCQKVEILANIPTSTCCQNCQKSELLTMIPDVATGHRWHDAQPVRAVALLDELLESGATLTECDGSLRVHSSDLDEQTRAAVRTNQTALLALWRFRQHAQTRIRRTHWIVPDAALLKLWREAERHTGRALTIAGNLRRNN